MRTEIEIRIERALSVLKSSPEEIEYYFCGPPMMAQSIFSALDQLGVPEENIAFDDFGE